jgi:hypothetical protein
VDAILALDKQQLSGHLQDVSILCPELPACACNLPEKKEASSDDQICHAADIFAGTE